MFGPFQVSHSGHPAVPDPMSLCPPVSFIAASNHFFPDHDNPNGKTAVSPALVGGQTTLVLIIAGQSLTTNVVPGVYTPTNALNHNFSITDGGCYTANGPLLGCTGFAPTLGWPASNFASWLGDQLITGGIAQRVILVPIGVGGSIVADWASTGANNSRIQVTANRLAVAGLTPSAFLWEQGTSDLGTSQISYTASLNSMIASVRTSFGSTLPIFIAQESWNAGSTSAAVRAAQASVVNHASAIWLGPDCDSLNATNRQADNTHWNTTGASANAALWKTALHLFGAPF